MKKISDCRVLSAISGTYKSHTHMHIHTKRLKDLVEQWVE